MTSCKMFGKRGQEKNNSDVSLPSAENFDSSADSGGLFPSINVHNGVAKKSEPEYIQPGKAKRPAHSLDLSESSTRLPLIASKKLTSDSSLAGRVGRFVSKEARICRSPSCPSILDIERERYRTCIEESRVNEINRLPQIIRGYGATKSEPGSIGTTTFQYESRHRELLRGSDPSERRQTTTKLDPPQYSTSPKAALTGALLLPLRQSDFPRKMTTKRSKRMKQSKRTLKDFTLEENDADDKGNKRGEVFITAADPDTLDLPMTSFVDDVIERRLQEVMTMVQYTEDDFGAHDLLVSKCSAIAPKCGVAEHHSGDTSDTASDSSKRNISI